MISRWDVIEVHGRATSTAAKLFLDTLERRLPFPLRALQVDDGGEFAAVFEQACHERGVKLFVLPPRSPKLNGQVERANRTPTEEFYEIPPFSLPLAELNRELQAWEQTYNTIRPHQALGISLPRSYWLNRHLKERSPIVTNLLDEYSGLTTTSGRVSLKRRAKTTEMVADSYRFST
jgi:putative transposase